MKVFKIPAIMLVVGLLIIAGLSRYWAKGAEESSAVIQQAQQALNAGNAYRARLRLLQWAAKQNADSARAWQRVAEAKGGLIRSLDTALTKAVTMRESLTVVLEQRDTLKAQLTLWQAVAKKWETADQADSTRAALAESRTAALEANLQATLRVADCHILGASWLPRCLSRSASFVAGGGIATLVLLVTHH